MKLNITCYVVSSFLLLLLSGRGIDHPRMQHLLWNENGLQSCILQGSLLPHQFDHYQSSFESYDKSLIDLHLAMHCQPILELHQSCLWLQELCLSTGQSLYSRSCAVIGAFKRHEVLLSSSL